MTKFRATNGHAVSSYGHGGIWLAESCISISKNDAEALREFFRVEEDERLGIWRWPEDPSIIVYPNEEYRSVYVAKEGTPKSVYWAENEMIWVIDSDAPFPRAARAYFEAHPAPKPWHDAKSGEVWALRFEDDADEFAAVRVDGRWKATEGGWPNENLITAGRRIWPEEAPGE